jgi:hypothetical protein
LTIANNKLKDFGDKAFELLEFYKQHPVIAAEDLLGFEMPAPQRVLFEDMWFKPYVLVTAGRGGGKTALLSVISTLYAMLNAGVKVLLMSPSFRQCVVGDTWVITNKGFKKVSELVSKPDYLCSDEGMFKCLGFYINPKTNVKRIKTRRGYTLGGALDHMVLLLDGSYITLDKISTGDSVPVVAGCYSSCNTLDELYKDFYSGKVISNSNNDLRFRFLDDNALKNIFKFQITLLDLNVITRIDDNDLVVDDEISIRAFDNILNHCILENKIEQRFILNEVSEVSYDFEETYDFTVDEKEKYFSNGFISHNSKMIFEEVDKRYTNSPILREACDKRPIISSDRCYLTFRGVGDKPGSSVEAYPLGNDGAKIRGLRGHCILADEFAQIPKEIFDMVIRPMGATTSSPMENVKKIKYLKEQLEKGYISEDEFDDEKSGTSSNKIICTSSAYYQFNHMYERIKSYENEIEKGSNKYATHCVSYEDMPEGFLDLDNIEEAKISMSKSEFDMEYRGIWQSDSDGVFKASLVEQSTSKDRTVSLHGEAGKKYVIGVDPARSSDAFATVVIEIGNPSIIVAAYQSTNNKFPQMSQFIFDLCDKFDPVLIKMDAGSGGGGVAIKDLLANEQFFGKRIIVDMEDEEYKNSTGRKLVKMFDPNPNSIAEINYNSLNILEQGILKFPKQPVDFDEKKEKIYEDIKLMIKQTISIVATETKSGVAHFDIPATGKGKRKKDLYSAFILAASGLYSIVNNKKEDDTNIVNNCGLIIPRRSVLMPSISNATNFFPRR